MELGLTAALLRLFCRAIQPQDRSFMSSFLSTVQKHLGGDFVAPFEEAVTRLLYRSWHTEPHEPILKYGLEIGGKWLACEVNTASQHWSVFCCLDQSSRGLTGPLFFSTIDLNHM